MRRERGVAAVTAILIVAVAASAATMMLSQQSAMLDQTMLVSGRAQADQYAQAGLDWARGVLAQDGRASQVDSLDEIWARPIAAMPIERAVVAGAIADEQGKFNLNNLMNGSQRNADNVSLLRQLLASLELDPALAEAVAEWIDPNGVDAYYLSLPIPYRAPRGPMAQVEELHRVRGFGEREVTRLAPYVTVLPPGTTINVNTASDRVIAASLGVAIEKVAPLLEERATKPFANEAAFRQSAGKLGVIPVHGYDVKSAWFSVRVHVSQDEVELATEALVKREVAPRQGSAIIWRRPRY